MSKFDVFQQSLPFQKSSLNESPTSFRAWVSLTHVRNGDAKAVVVKCLFPPCQLVAPESREVFDSLLQQFLDGLKADGVRLHAVSVFQGGKPLSSFDPNA